MANKKYSDYSAANSIDGSADYFLISPANTDVYLRINRSTALGISGSPVGNSDSQTLSNKTIGNTNTVTLKDTLFTLQDDGDATKQVVFQLSGITTGNTRTLTIPDASTTLVGTATTQTLTGKTLTSPTITGGTIDNTTVTVDTIAGHTSGTTGTVYGVAITAGKIPTAGLANASVTPSILGTGAATNAVATSQTTTSSSFTDLSTPGPAVTVTIGANGLALVILSSLISNNTAGDYGVMGFAVSGTSTIAATFVNSLAIQAGSTSNEMGGSYAILVTGLATGSTTFTAKYEIITGGTGTFRNRNITVIPL